MKYLLSFLFLLSIVSNAQPLKEINFKYLYDTEEPLRFHLKTVRESNQWKCLYSISSQDSSQVPDQIVWEIRNSNIDSDGEHVPADNVKRILSSPSLVTGSIDIPISENAKFLVATLTIKGGTKRSFYSTLDPKYPITDYLLLQERFVISNYIKVNSEAALGRNGTYTVSYYDDVFPTAPLAFSETVGKVPKQMKIDSTFTVQANERISLNKTGLYLFQRDTAAAEGVATRVEDDYPKYAKLKSIAEPLVYICTSQEYAKIKQAKDDKKAFDRVILNITKDPERAKNLMRAYFKRVEAANGFFTSYKEGWKTDRGMIYIIFGLPDEVFRYSDREVWNYKHTDYKVNFEFVKSPSLFDPENYVLIRNRKYTETWYEVVDLWRNARF